jgi:hypothetical protein
MLCIEHLRPTDPRCLENSSNMKEIIEKIKTDPRYRKNIEYGEPRSGHPEGRVKFHIADLEANLEILAQRNISGADYWKLKFIIHIHDSFKAEAQEKTTALHSRNHANLAKVFANQYTNDTDLLNIILFHDENFDLWQEYIKTGKYNKDRFQELLNTIKDWDLFLMFVIIDGCTEGKDLAKLVWFIDEVRKYKKTIVDSSWIIPPEEFHSSR